MTTLELARMLLLRWQADFRTPETNRLDLSISAPELQTAVSALLAGHWGYLAGITGLDHGDALELLYHFASGAVIVTLRVKLARATPSLASICRLVPAASVFEREVSELFGVTFRGAPDTARLFLPDDWPEGVYPLLKDAVLPEVDHDHAD